MLTREQQGALVQWRELLEESGLDRVLARPPGAEPSPVAEGFQALADLFDQSKPVERRDFDRCVPSGLLATLEKLGLLIRAGERIRSPYQLVFHCGLALYSEKVTPSAKFYYGNDSIELSRMLQSAHGNVLDVCSGVGTQALVAARTAARVTAVEIEPEAAKLFWINAAMNGLSGKVELLEGDLLEPVAGRSFDVICCNPPFMPVPPGVKYPRFADGGADGLGIVRRLMAGLPRVLEPAGRCEVVGAVLGNAEQPDLTAFKQMAADSSLILVVDCRTREELEGKTMQQLVEMALEGGQEDLERAFRSHFASLHATHLYCFLLHASRGPSPMVCASYHGGEKPAFWMAPVP